MAQIKFFGIKEALNPIKKQLIQLLFQRITDQFGIAPQDLEITIFETPKQNWGIRGVPGDELQLNYKVNI
ncbi:tautomerase family protein [Paenibacillus polymyxa]|nr:tautomerase family protein [Paenibacillus polymyxa]WDM20667.1 tautomerase family protein [Paenibacillus polymyxa]